VAAAREREDELRAAIGRAEGEEKRLAADRAEVATAKALAEEQKKAAEADRVGPGRYCSPCHQTYFEPGGLS